jgi:PAS domain S-box-containing protein
MNEAVSPFVLLTIATASACLGVAVYQRQRDRVWNRIFAAHATVVSVWVVITYLIQIADTPETANLYIRLAHPACALAITTLLDLFWVFPERTAPAPWQWRAAAYGMAALASTVSFHPHLIESVRLAQGTVLPDYGWPFHPWSVYIAAVLAYADAVMIRKIPRLSGVERAQVKYVLMGVVITQVIGVVVMLILPGLFKNSLYTRWGTPAYIFVIGFTAYAIAKHRLIRPAVAVAHAGGYAITGVVLAGIIGLCLVGARQLSESGGPFTALSYLVVGALIGGVAPSLHSRVRRLVTHSRNTGALREGSRHVSEAILRTLDVEELPEFLAGAIEGILRPTFVAVYWRDRRSRVLSRRVGPARGQSGQDGGLPQSLSLDCLLAVEATAERKLIERSQVWRFYSMERAEPLLAAMRTVDADLVAPVLWEDELAGLMLIGEKRSGDMYGPEEIGVLQNMLPQVSLAVRNAQLYDEVVQVKEYTENILREMKSGVIAVDSDQCIVVANPAAEEILGLQASWMVGRTLEVLPPSITRALMQVLSGVPVRGEERFQITRPNGLRVPVACSCSIWRGTGQATEGAVAVVNDLTLVEELARERQEAEHLALIRVLSAGMAHELRNPLVAIRTFSELLPVRWDDEEFRSAFQQMAKDEIDRIERLLTDLLMLSKPADAVVEPVEVDQLCEGVVRTLSALAESRGVSLEATLRTARARPVGDQSRLHQALVNLVKNAIEAEPSGGRVEVSASSIGGYGEASHVLITVFNPNSLIEEDQLSLIFKPFYTKRHGGTGLGLAICQTIVEEHDGHIAVTSRAGQGTEFAIELPLKTESGEHGHGRAVGS